MGLREPPEWFNKSSVSVLEFLNHYEIAMTVSTIQYNLLKLEPGQHGGKTSIRDAVNDLHDHGWVDKGTWSGRGTAVYRINDRGSAWLETGSIPDELDITGKD